jgi:hypothetical protein
MVMPFLERISLEMQGKFADLCTMEREKYKKMLEAVERVSSTLAGFGISHAVFKTIRPYTSTTVDIDTVIFGNHADYELAMRAMGKSGYAMLGVGPASATFWDSTANIGVDLYDEIAVSALCYLDKDQLSGFSKNTILPNGKTATLLGPEADLVAIVAHSLIKEQMYTLSEYYSFVKYLGKMDENIFIDLLRKANLTNAAKTHASITALLFESVHGKISSKLQNILERLGQDSFEMNRIRKRELKSPHKYHPLTVGKSLFEIAKGKKTRTSAALQIYRMTYPGFTRRFLEEFLKHLIRETY